jgi:tetratricopeptide (TPR) repeat protein
MIANAIEPSLGQGIVKSGLRRTPQFGTLFAWLAIGLAMALALACFSVPAAAQDESKPASGGTSSIQQSNPADQNAPPAKPSDPPPPKAPDAAPPPSPGESSSRRPGDDAPPEDASDPKRSKDPDGPPPEKPADTKSIKSDANSPQPPAAAQPDGYDPYHAEKSLEIGSYYQRRGNLDAAADRYKDAIQYKPDFARPRILLAEIYEKKRDYPQAIRYYNEYLKILPNGPEAKRAKERVEKLTQQRNDSSN